MSSDDDTSQLMAAFKKRKPNASAPPTRPTPTRTRSPSIRQLSRSPSSSSPPPEQLRRRRVVAVRPSPVRNRAEYVYYEPTDDVETILREFSRRGNIMYDVRMSSGKTTQVTFADLIELPGGSDALRSYTQYDDDSSTTAGDDDNMKLRTNATRSTNSGFVDISTVNISSSDSDDEIASTAHTTRARRGRPSASRGRSSGRLSMRTRGKPHIELTSSDDDSEPKGKRRKRRTQPQEPPRRSGRQPAPRQRESSEDEGDNSSETDSSGSDILRSDLLPGRKRKRSLRTFKPEKTQRVGVRQSGRSTRATDNMEEIDIDDMFHSDSTPKPVAPKITVVREEFVTLPRSSLFRARHAEGCEVCYDGLHAGPLIYCQGCSLAYHKNCLGTRTTREHLVTKVGDHDFVLQCKRCVDHYKRKDPTAPVLSQCQDCGREGAACHAFRAKKTTQQEMKEREENNGEDPVVDVPSELINNAHNVLFRCTKCSRAWHYHHLPPLSQYSMDIVREDDETAAERFREYSGTWLCKECDETKEMKIGGIVAWRPSDVESYVPGTPCEDLGEDEKQYLIKWEDHSYFRAVWVSGAWTWGVAAPAMRKAFFKREQGPKMRTEDAIPEEFLRIDIVLDIKYTSYVEVRSEEIDKARIKEVDKALIKYKGLGYEDAVWEQVPTPEDGDRWLDFVTAYNDWVAGRYVKVPKTGPLKSRVEKARSTPFAKLERSSQPDNLVGGELMKYQIEGLNWLYYQWYCQKNGILADEMGLGKTIQVIGFMATLIQEHNCFPFLIVVPNSTCANWRREIKQWAPALRVVAYFGSSQARQMAHKYEMYPEGAKDLRCHIVVTSYEAAADDSCRRFFRGVNWAGLIIDEGQRLKNDKSQLYTALTAVKAPYRLLLTGTPLQNNTRELFNLLQFLDETVNAEELEEKYAEMTSENIKELHAQIRPYILRRTKAQVLTFLPPLGQIILPISMSTLQKQLYKSILSKSPQLLKALFTSDNLKQQERASLNNILMQLRKCLCHPFVYSREIEERTNIAAVSHRNLVEASAKLHLLETLLPKLKERGHRVLIFSQFLDMLSIIEDFLDGMEMSYQRLDGTMGSLEKQKRIDQFNAPDSNLFAFLLSTRAGGVGINLATADTVIILDPDFNPHQDMQAIARAHRIGQKNKVLCFQLLTRASVEEKIVQMGRKKMALDHVVVEQLDAEEDESQDVESILKYGAAELFKDDADQEIRYDDASIDKLLDRSQIENTKSGADDSAESTFSFARVWANDTGSLKDDLDILEEDAAPDPGVWDRILKERQAAAAAEAEAKAEALGRGRRARMNVDYEKDRGNAIDDGVDDRDSVAPPSPAKVVAKSRRKRRESDSDTDFQADSEEESEPEPEAEGGVQHELAATPAQRHTGLVALPSKTPKSVEPRRQNYKIRPVCPPYPDDYPEDWKKGPDPVPKGPQKSPQKGSHSKGHVSLKYSSATAKPAVISLLDSPSPSPPPNPPTNTNPVKPFVRAHIPIRSPLAPPPNMYNNFTCPACGKLHPRGACDLKAAGVEHCGLCGLAHYGIGRTCPHIRSETQVREMMAALKRSNESRELIEIAMKYLRGVKGTLVQQKKKDREKAEAMAQGNGVGQGPGIAPKTTGPGAGIPRPLPGQYNGPNAHVQPAPMYPGSAGANRSGSGSGNAGPSTAGPPARTSAQARQTSEAQQNKWRFNEKEAEVALQEFLKGPR